MDFRIAKHFEEFNSKQKKKQDERLTFHIFQNVL